MQQRVSHLDRARLALQLPSLQYDTVRDNAVQLGTVPCSTAPYRTGYSSAPLLPKRTRRERLPPHLYPPHASPRAGSERRRGLSLRGYKRTWYSLIRISTGGPSLEPDSQ
jgi:hypothetical protein